MPEPYIIEAPKPKPERPSNILTRIESKLDRLLNSGGDHDNEHGDGEPGITFSADPEGLPTAPTIDDDSDGEGSDDDDGAGTGEGTENVAHPVKRAFRHPSARRETVEV